MACNWDWADDFLKRGRKKYERPLYDRGLRIWKEDKWSPDSDINIGWKYNQQAVKMVTYHKDGTTTINGIQKGTYYGGNASYVILNSQSTRLTIHRYAGIQVFQRNFKFYLQEDNAPLTPAKIQGCRTCKQTGLQDSWCSSTTCWNTQVDDEGQVVCKEHPDALMAASWRGWHYVPCEHGNNASHVIPKGEPCHYCRGSKKRDYGSKPERTQWDGTPLRLHDGKLIKSPTTLLERMMADYAEPIS